MMICGYPPPMVLDNEHRLWAVRLHAWSVGMMAKGEGGRIFFGALESWRGVAAVIVAWFYALLVHGDNLMIVKQGAIFVDFFFFLSSFVIAHAYLDKTRDGLGFQKFALLRLAHVYPAAPVYTCWRGCHSFSCDSVCLRFTALALIRQSAIKWSLLA